MFKPEITKHHRLEKADFKVGDRVYLEEKFPYSRKVKKNGTGWFEVVQVESYKVLLVRIGKNGKKLKENKTNKRIYDRIHLKTYTKNFIPVEVVNKLQQGA